ncbi:isoprenylcysteine carboxylmethyltransferase family protein [Mannheimia indoligenes]|uniref:methyltransferase family protein n=1 Tax=Mannheimia indoligenes TaxID=3103145 RepID=UPI002FE55C3D
MLKLKVPPPVWFLFCAALMWWIGRVLPVHFPNYQHPIIFILGALIAVIGLVIAISAVVTMRKAETTSSPFQPQNTFQIVDWGIYRKSRNPMYLSLLLGLIVWALWLGSIFAWFVLPLFIGLITHFQIKPEEQILTQKFGQRYLDYASRVRRWL